MSYSPMQDACPHSIPISDISSGDIHIVELVLVWHQAPADISKFKARILYILRHQ
jgi:hypothetical protein